MIDVREHVYDDDPGVGPADVRTELPGVDYFFLGNGLIQAAVQAAPLGTGTPVGLLIMDPDRLRKKREALTMDPAKGLDATLVRVVANGRAKARVPGAFTARWETRSAVPTVAVDWRAGALRVKERFSCPDPEHAAVFREISIRNTGKRPFGGKVVTGVRDSELRKRFFLRPGSRKVLTVRYSLDRASGEIDAAFGVVRPSKPQAAHWEFARARISTGNPRLDHFLRASMCQLPASVSRRGVLDGSIWQYNREWCRDQSVTAVALTMIGEIGLARTILARLLDDFVTPDGDTVDSSERRGPDEIELDQNGFLLGALHEHALWTGDLGLVRERWPRIRALAEFPLRATFRHAESGLLANRREFWERHRAYGIRPGLELAHQVYSWHGLASAAELARMTGKSEAAARWENEARRIRQAMLEDPVYRMVDNRGFIKRRGLDGRIQETIDPEPGSGLPPESPLAKPGRHFLNPDTSAALPVVLGLVLPQSPLCRLTLHSLEALWNQAWSGGGYGRYNVTSEPDSPGGWPFASLFVARAAVEMGEMETVRRILDWLASVPGAKAGSWLEFYGKRQSPPFPQVGITPWTWAEMIILVVHHLLGVRPGASGLVLRPRLLPGIGRVRAEFSLRGRRVSVEYRISTRDGRIEARLDGRLLKSREGLKYTQGPLWRIDAPFSPSRPPRLS
jgi:hypothetical protein